MSSSRQGRACFDARRTVRIPHPSGHDWYVAVPIQSWADYRRRVVNKRLMPIEDRRVSRSEV